VSARVATGGIPSARRAPHAEAALAGCQIDSFAAAQAALDQDTAPGGDWRASAEYRAHAARVLLGRALRRAVEAARNVESGG
jgi:xanthine dehydrogenase small subunit